MESPKQNAPLFNKIILARIFISGFLLPILLSRDTVLFLSPSGTLFSWLLLFGTLLQAVFVAGMEGRESFKIEKDQRSKTPCPPPRPGEGRPGGCELGCRQPRHGCFVQRPGEGSAGRLHPISAQTMGRPDSCAAATKASLFGPLCLLSVACDLWAALVANTDADQARLIGFLPNGKPRHSCSPPPPPAPARVSKHFN